MTVRPRGTRMYSLRLSLVCFVVACSYGAPSKHPTTRIAFGSCNKQYEPQPLWQEILRLQPLDLWVWGGDNIYADRRRSFFERAYLYLQGDDRAKVMFESATQSKLRADYQHQLSHPDYAQLVRNIPVVGIWDDHDYGINDGNKNFADKSASKQEFLDFIGASKNDPRRSQDGVYDAYTLGSGNHTVKVILLDVRFNRDPWPHQKVRAMLNRMGSCG